MSLTKCLYLVEHWLPPGYQGSTGGTLYNYKLVESLADICELQVFALYAPERVTPPGVRLEVFFENKRKLLPWRFANWRSDLMDQVRKCGTDTVILTTSATNAVLRDLHCTGYKTMAVVQAYEDFGHRVPGGDVTSKLRGIKRLLATGQKVRPALSCADGVIVNSKYMAMALERLLGRKVNAKILYPPLTIPVDHSAKFSAEALRRVGFVNRAGKNLEFVARLARETPEFEFLVFGHTVALKKKLPSNMILKGWASDKERMFRSAHTWLMPSRWQEPFGMVAIEALSQGCRVAVSAHGGLPEAVGDHGAIFKSFDVGIWRNWLLSSDCRVDMQSQLNHVRRFDMDTFRSRLVEIFLDFSERESTRVR